MSKHILIVGATSAIAKALAARLAQRDCALVLAGRDQTELDTIAADLRLRYQVAVEVEPLDALDFDRHAEFFRRAIERAGGKLDGVAICHGYLPDQKKAESDWSEARRTLDVNFTSAVSLLELAANHMEANRSGWLTAISSVAGDRGRQSNYLYGAAKGGLSVYLDGLRNRLYHAGVHVLSIKPGFVDTPMTHGLLKAGSPLVATPERVAQDIDRALARRKNTLYTPWFWRIIMGIICLVPEPIFKRMRL